MGSFVNLLFWSGHSSKWWYNLTQFWLRSLYESGFYRGFNRKLQVCFRVLGKAVECSGLSSHMGCQHPLLECLRSTSTSAPYPAFCQCMSWQEQTMNVRTWAWATHAGDLTGVLVSWRQCGPAASVTGIWGVNQKVKDHSDTLPYNKHK